MNNQITAKLQLDPETYRALLIWSRTRNETMEQTGNAAIKCFAYLLYEQKRGAKIYIRNKLGVEVVKF
ncbi:TPA: hypothetical protein QDB06_000805 [Burkholderia vietnamiensis]|nr:hypothetical protein [Burkholderia vietnamiensis]